MLVSSFSWLCWMWSICLSNACCCVQSSVSHLRYETCFNLDRAWKVSCDDLMCTSRCHLIAYLPSQLINHLQHTQREPIMGQHTSNVKMTSPVINLTKALNNSNQFSLMEVWGERVIKMPGERLSKQFTMSQSGKKGREEQHQSWIEWKACVRWGHKRREFSKVSMTTTCSMVTCCCCCCWCYSSQGKNLKIVFLRYQPPSQQQQRAHSSGTESHHENIKIIFQLYSTTHAHQSKT